MIVINMKRIFIFLKPHFWALLCLGLLLSCKKYLELPAPGNSIGAEAAYSDDRAIAAMINDALQKISRAVSDEEASSVTGSSHATLGLHTDEMEPLFGLNPLDDAINPNSTQIFSWKLAATNITAVKWWPNYYAAIYVCNSILENVPKQSTLNLKNQWLGQAYFLRALAYYYLVNLYGDVSLVTSTNYKESSKIPRTAPEMAYSLIQADLKQAISLLDPDYKDEYNTTTTERFRPNQSTAKALLARINLYTRQWQQAWDNADQVIKDTRYTMQPKATIGATFTATSKELILGSDCDLEARLFGDFSTPPCYLSSALLNAFEPKDLRRTNWIQQNMVVFTSPFQIKMVDVPSKFKNPTRNSTKLDRMPLLRLAEQYLIRAEAAAQLAKQGDGSKLTGAIADLNIIRLRAGLGVTTAATPDAVLDAIAKERRVEFFGEWGQRFFDLKRTGKLDAQMKIEMETSRLGTGAKWESYKQNMPISIQDQTLGIAQTPGY